MNHHLRVKRNYEGMHPEGHQNDTHSTGSMVPDRSDCQSSRKGKMQTQQTLSLGGSLPLNTQHRGPIMKALLLAVIVICLFGPTNSTVTCTSGSNVNTGGTPMFTG